MTTTAIIQHAADATRAGEQAMGRVRRVSEDLHTAVTSALRLLDDAMLHPSPTATDPLDLHIKVESRERLQTHVVNLSHQAYGLYGHLTLASLALAEAHYILSETDASDPKAAPNIAQLKARVAVASDMASHAKPVARLAIRHVAVADHTCQRIDATTSADPARLQHSILTARQALSHAAEDIRQLEDVVDHTTAQARPDAGIATEISDNARRRMSEHSRDPASNAAPPARRPPAR